jgi:hypothetical protein
LNEEVKVIKWSSSPVMETVGSGRKLKRGGAWAAGGSVSMHGRRSGGSPATRSEARDLTRRREPHGDLGFVL